MFSDELNMRVIKSIGAKMRSIRGYSKFCNPLFKELII